jgi:hypothetical protein
MVTVLGAPNSWLTSSSLNVVQVGCHQQPAKGLPSRGMLLQQRSNTRLHHLSTGQGSALEFST